MSRQSTLQHLPIGRGLLYIHKLVRRGLFNFGNCIYLVRLSSPCLVFDLVLSSFARMFRIPVNVNVDVDVSHLLCNTAFTSTRLSTYHMNSHKRQGEAG
jgi:hypothetical protein